MSARPRRKLAAIDDPLAASAAQRMPARRQREPTTALYVELPVAQWDTLARAAFELRTHKRRIVAALIAAHVDATTSEGLERLRDLLEADRHRCS